MRCPPALNREWDPETHTQQLRALYKYCGQNQLTSKDNQGQTPIDYATEHNYVQFFQVFRHPIPEVVLARQRLALSKNLSNRLAADSPAQGLPEEVIGNIGNTATHLTPAEPDA